MNKSQKQEQDFAPSFAEQVAMVSPSDSRRRLVLFHGTSAENARRIMREGYKPDLRYNWKVKSKEGFVYLSSAYAPFYAEHLKGVKKALIKVEVFWEDCYPEDDFIMFFLGKPKYSVEDLAGVDFERYKFLAGDSYKYMGNVAVKPDKVRILGCTFFSSKMLVLVCDPVISPLNFRVMGDYHRNLSEWIFEGKNPLDFRRPFIS